MQEFIDLVTTRLGIGEAESKSAASGIMSLVKDQLDESSFLSFIAKIPGGSEFLAENPPETNGSPGGGLMGSLASMAGGLLGGRAAGIAGVVSAIAASGISVDQAGGFLKTLIEYIKDKIGDDSFNHLATKLPDLLGSAGSPDRQ